MMRTQVIKSFITAKNSAEIQKQVECLLVVSGKVISRNEKEIEEFFNDGYEYTTPLLSEIVEKFTLRGEMNGNWETTITVQIIAYYHDPGSDDYVYMVKVDED